MSIGKSFIITFIIIVTTIGFELILSLTTFYGNIHFMGIAAIIISLLVYGTVWIYLHKTITRVGVIENSTAPLSIGIFGILFIILIGCRIFQLPFIKIKDISNILFDTSYPTNTYSKKTNFIYLLIFYRGISTILLAPFFEEFIFRYYVFGGLVKKHSFKVSLVISSICFALIHFETPTNLIPALIFGLIAGTIYYRTKKIHYTIILHMAYNTEVTINRLLTKNKYYYLDILPPIIEYLILPIIGGLICIFLLKLIPKQKEEY